MDALEKLKLLTEETGPEAAGAEACESAEALLSPRMYTDAELDQLLGLYEGDVNAAAYHVLVRKAQSTKMSLAGMTLPETSEYWLRLARTVRQTRHQAAERADQP